MILCFNLVFGIKRSIHNCSFMEAYKEEKAKLEERIVGGTVSFSPLAIAYYIIFVFGFISAIFLCFPQSNFLGQAEYQTLNNFPSKYSQPNARKPVIFWLN